MPYQVTAPDGLTATAVVYVPGTRRPPRSGSGRARGSRSSRSGTATVPLSSVLLDTSGRQLQITTIDQLSASPARRHHGERPPGRRVQRARARRLHRARRRHRARSTTAPPAGPARPHRDADHPGPGRPGRARAALPAGRRCRSSRAARRRAYDIGQLCHVWVDTTVTAPTAPVQRPPGSRRSSGVSASIVPAAPACSSTAASSAAPGQYRDAADHPGRRRTAGGTVSVTVVIKAPPPTGRPVTRHRSRPATASTVNLAQYVTSPLAQPDIQVLSVTHPAGATVTSSGSVVTITPARQHSRHRQPHRDGDRRARPGGPLDQRRHHRHRHRLARRARRSRRRRRPATPSR